MDTLVWTHFDDIQQTKKNKNSVEYKKTYLNVQRR